MRFMLIMIPGINEDAWEPKPEDIEAMTKYNEELSKAGILLALDGLHPSSKGARVTYPGGKATVTDGPFTESKELVGGYWIIQAKSKEEAVEWASRVPGGEGDIVEVRQIYEMEDFSPEIREVDMSGVKPSAPATER
jgi:hypothetical protein